MLIVSHLHLFTIFIIKVIPNIVFNVLLLVSLIFFSLLFHLFLVLLKIFVDLSQEPLLILLVEFIAMSVGLLGFPDEGLETATFRDHLDDLRLVFTKDVRVEVVTAVD